MQWRAALWITGAFCTSPTWGVEAIAGLISIHFYLDKLIGYYHLWVALFPKQHAINTLLDKHHSKQAIPHHITTRTFKQNLKIKSPIVDINYCLNQILLVFNNLNKELSPGFCLVDTFSNCFSFNVVKYKDTKVRTTHLNKLKNIYRASKDDPNTLFIISDMSLKNNVVISVTHIQQGQVLITKAIYYAMNISTTKVELFTIR